MFVVQTSNIKLHGLIWILNEVAYKLLKSSSVLKSCVKTRHSRGIQNYVSEVFNRAWIVLSILSPGSRRAFRFLILALRPPNHHSTVNIAYPQCVAKTVRFWLTFCQAACIKARKDLHVAGRSYEREHCRYLKDFYSAFVKGTVSTDERRWS